MVTIMEFVGKIHFVIVFGIMTKVLYLLYYFGDPVNLAFGIVLIIIRALDESDGVIGVFLFFGHEILATHSVAMIALNFILFFWG